MTKKIPKGTIVLEKGETENTLTPEGIIMLIIAACFDAAQLLVFIPVLGWIATIFTNIIALIFFTLWAIIRGKDTRQIIRVGKAKKWAKRKKWVRPAAKIANIMPMLDYVTFFLPLWTIIVYIELVYRS